MTWVACLKWTSLEPAEIRAQFTLSPVLACRRSCGPRSRSSSSANTGSLPALRLTVGKAIRDKRLAAMSISCLALLVI